MEGGGGGAVISTVTATSTAAGTSTGRSGRDGLDHMGVGVVRTAAGVILECTAETWIGRP